MAQIWQFSSPTKIVFGPGSIKNVVEEIRALKSKRVMVISDPGIKKAGLLDKVISLLLEENLDYCVFDNVEPNPSIEIVENAHYQRIESHSDLVIGIGGGSSIDTAKLIALLATNEPPIIQYEGANKVLHQALPIIAIPTTCGTGSEVTQSAVVTDKIAKAKRSIRSPKIQPAVAILDPELITTLPPMVAASTGMDALAHALEAYVSTQSFPLSDCLALYAMNLISSNIRQFVGNRSNLTSAASMLLGSMIAGSAFVYARLGTPHAMSLPLGAYYNVPHGTACAVILPYVMEDSWMGNPVKFAEISKILGNSKGSINELAAKAAQGIRQLNNDLGIPTTLTGYDINSSDIDNMSDYVIKSGIHLSNPRTSSREDIIRYYRAVLGLV